MLLRKRQRLVKACLVKKQSDTYTQRRSQYAALYALRRIKTDGADDSEYIHSLSYLALDSEAFRDIDAAECQRLHQVVQAMGCVVGKRAVTLAAMRRALTASQFNEYTDSFDIELSHVESEYSDDMPSMLLDYAEIVKRGDKYERIANLFRRAVKRDTNGRTARQRYLVKAERSYETAVQMLCNVLELDPTRNPNADVAQAANVARWLDREVDTRDGYQPDITREGVPRLRGSKSKFSQDTQRAVVGQRLRKHWREREALVNAALELMYDEQELERQMDAGLQNTTVEMSSTWSSIKPTQQPCA